MGSLYKGCWSLRDKSIDYIIEFGDNGLDTEKVKVDCVWANVGQGMCLMKENATMSVITKLWTINSASYCPVLELLAQIQTNDELLYQEFMESLILKSLIPEFIDEDALLELDEDEIQDLNTVLLDETVDIVERDPTFTAIKKEKPFRKKIPFKSSINVPREVDLSDCSLDDQNDPEFILGNEDLELEKEDIKLDDMTDQDLGAILNDDHTYELKMKLDLDGTITAPQETVKENRSVNCENCDEIFDGEVNLYNHMVLSHPEVEKPNRPEGNFFGCSKCPHLLFEDKPHLRSHMKEHRAKHFCPLCTNSFSSKARVYRHCTIKHKKEKHLWPEPSNESGVKRLYQLLERTSLECAVCKLTLNNTFGLVKHERTHVEAFTCIICGTPCYKAEALIEHTDEKHSEKNEFLCRICGYFCYSEATLRHHNLNTHDKSEAKQYKCNICTFTTHNSNTYYAHIRTHKLKKGGKKYMCEDCGKEFPNLSKIRNHKLSHKAEGNAKYSCKFCTKKFHMISVLKIHERVHTGEKPFDCKDCTLKFSSKSSLIKHTENMHTNIEDMAYRCNECGKGFSKSRKKLYLGHIKQHSGIKDHACPQCNASFSCRPYLANHFKKVHKQRLADVEQQSFVCYNNTDTHTDTTETPSFTKHITISIVP